MSVRMSYSVTASDSTYRVHVAWKSGDLLGSPHRDNSVMKPSLQIFVVLYNNGFTDKVILFQYLNCH